MAEKNIEVKIGNRSYPLTIDESEEAKLKAAAQVINDNINKLKGNYVVTDYVDLLAMTALELALGSDETETLKVSAESKILDTELDQISSLIDSCLETGESS
ncbi:MAG: cell division protein ZapA [Salibacteraceae bacterium]